MSFDKLSLASLLSCCLAALSPNATFAAPVEFRVLGGSGALRADRTSDVLTDIHGFFGIPGRTLRIDAFHLSPSAPGSVQDGGFIDFVSARMAFAVDYKVDYDLLDAQTGSLVGTDSVSGFFPMYGGFDPTTGLAFLDGEALPGRTNGDTTASVLAIQAPGWLRGVRSQRTVLYLPFPDEFLAGNPTTLQYFGDADGFGEMNLLASPDFGGGTLVATNRGSLQIQAVPAPAVGMFLIAPAIFATRRRR